MSVSVIEKYNVGNLRCNAISFVASAAEENIATGFDVVRFFTVGIKSVTTSAYMMQENKDSSGAASNGSIGCSGLVAGDEMFIAVYGR